MSWSINKKELGLWGRCGLWANVSAGVSVTTVWLWSALVAGKWLLYTTALWPWPSWSDTREGNIYTWECLFVHISGVGVLDLADGVRTGGVLPSGRWTGYHILPDGGGGGRCPQVRMGGGGITPSQVRIGERYLSQVRMWWYPGVHPVRTGWGYPTLGLDGGTPPHQVRTGWRTAPPPGPGDRETEQLCAGRYASCVHAGGLSCWI